MITYSSGSGEKDPRGIYIMELAGKSTKRITDKPANDVAPSFSPEGTEIAFRRNGQGLFVTSVLGGTERKLSEYGSNPRWSPDGRRIVFDVGDSDILRSKLFLIPVEGGEPKQYQSQFDAAWLPHWSPDGKHILFVGCRNLQEDEWDFWVAPPDQGSAVQTGIWEACRRAGLHDPGPGAWAPGGSEVFLWAYQGDTTNVWKIGLSSTFQALGEPVRVSSGAGEACCPSVGSDGRVAYKTVFRETKIVAVPELGPAGKKVPQDISHGPYHDVSPSVSADGKTMVFAVEHGSVWDIRLRNLENNSEQTMVPGLRCKVSPDPLMRPDGSEIAYVSEQGNNKELWVVGSQGAPRQRVCDDCGLPSDWRADGSGILFTPWHKPRPFPVSLLNRRTGRQIELLRHPTSDLQGARFSPDMQWLSFQAAPGASRRVIYVAPFAGDRRVAPTEWIQITEEQTNNTSACWGAADLLYFRSSRCHQSGCIWGQRLDLASRRLLGEPFEVYHNPQVTSSNRDVLVQDRVGLALDGGRFFYSGTYTPTSLWMSEPKPGL